MASQLRQRTTFQVGDVLVMRLLRSPDFFEVIKRTTCYVTLQRLASEVVEDHDGYAQCGALIPLKGVPSKQLYKPIVRARIRQLPDGSEECFTRDGRGRRSLKHFTGKPEHYWTD